MTPLEIRAKYALRNSSVVTSLQFLSEVGYHPEIQKIVLPLQEAAFQLVDHLRDGTTLTVAVNRLVDAKDLFIRHYLLTHNFYLPAIEIDNEPSQKDSI
jgi:hypothetical protein